MAIRFDGGPIINVNAPLNGSIIIQAGGHMAANVEYSMPPWPPHSQQYTQWVYSQNETPQEIQQQAYHCQQGPQQMQQPPLHPGFVPYPPGACYIPAQHPHQQTYGPYHPPYRVQKPCKKKRFSQKQHDVWENGAWYTKRGHKWFNYDHHEYQAKRTDACIIPKYRQLPSPPVSPATTFAHQMPWFQQYAIPQMLLAPSGPNEASMAEDVLSPVDILSCSGAQDGSHSFGQNTLASDQMALPPDTLEQSESSFEDFKMEDCNCDFTWLESTWEYFTCDKCLSFYQEQAHSSKTPDTELVSEPAREDSTPPAPVTTHIGTPEEIADVPSVIEEGFFAEAFASVEVPNSLDNL
ncbi:uncharacterized protein KY384_000706 [Bacidia gigantensis]|uniref:uncharacterized protein n=1 Tax=Bacidia gigantensis TaxID=2732470 RepID=UPI001D04AE7E|nr:uncharacterized protein KY384_000706 [Bacidia gigantensis]KAG8525944.1 hypothetical protein KY384_000706 [Bacidia gigantensis]